MKLGSLRVDLDLSACHFPSFLVCWVSMKATLEIPDALYREIKIRAARDGVKIKDLVAKSLSELIKQPPFEAAKPASQAKPKKKSIFPLFHGPGGPLLQQKELRSLSFLDEQDDLERYQRAFRR
jgi:hypothetical protein